MSQALDHVPPAELDGLVAALWQRSEAQAAFAVAVTERALAAARQAGQGDITTARLARLLATRLVYLGEREADAVQLASAAVAQLEVLAGPEAGACDLTAELAEARAALAMALDRRLPSAAEAQMAGAAAISAYTSLPVGPRRDGALATALHNQANRMKRARQVQVALALARQAWELTSPLHDARPASFRSLLADVEDTLSTLLYDDDQTAEAESMGRDALRLRRTLAATRPDAYRPALAATLFNLGLILSSGGGDRAEVCDLWTESVGIYDDLARHQPGRFDRNRDQVRERLGTLSNPSLGERRPDD
jgi:tetratricopeptide (TPR) repeat protein